MFNRPEDDSDDDRDTEPEGWEAVDKGEQPNLCYMAQELGWPGLSIEMEKAEENVKSRDCPLAAETRQHFALQKEKNFDAREFALDCAEAKQKQHDFIDAEEEKLE